MNYILKKLNEFEILADLPNLKVLCEEVEMDQTVVIEVIELRFLSILIEVIKVNPSSNYRLSILIDN